jgi:hypothetical protein
VTPPREDTGSVEASDSKLLNRIRSGRRGRWRWRWWRSQGGAGSGVWWKGRRHVGWRISAVMATTPKVELGIEEGWFIVGEIEVGGGGNWPNGG